MLTLIIPAYNEEKAVADVIRSSRNVLSQMGINHEIIVVDDGSSDETAEVARMAGAVVVTHPHNLGYGAALKSGIMQAQYDWIAIVDADGTYPIDEFSALLQYIPTFDMVVGARTGEHYWGSFLKQPTRSAFLWLGEFVTGTHIPDINSGMRIFRKEIALRHFERISSGFSFTTTLTLAMTLEGCFVKYVPISYHPRTGKSHIHPLRDTLRAGQIIVQAILYYNPIKLFLIIALFAVVLSFSTAALTLLVGPHPFLFLVWAGLALALLFFAFGLLADAIRTRNSGGMSSASLFQKTDAK